MTWRWVSLAFPLVLLGGCHFAQLPDPNDMQSADQLNVEVMQRNIAAAYSDLDLRVRQGQITQEEKDRKIKELVELIAGYLKPDNVDDVQAWRFADIYRQAGDLENARKFYERAVAVAKTEDRRVNDTLQLARVLAMQGNVKHGIEVAMTTFDAPPKEKAPIMMSALYEIVPAGLGKDADIELAQFLEAAIKQHMLVEVDANTEAGAVFLATAQVHITKAWEQVLKIYSNADRDDLLREAIDRRDKLSNKMGKA